MHLAGQSFMAEARTRKNVCFNFGARLPARPSPVPSSRHSRPYSAPVAALNYSECVKIRKIRPSVRPYLALSVPLRPLRRSIAAEKLAAQREHTFLTLANARQSRRRINRRVEVKRQAPALRNVASPRVKSSARTLETCFRRLLSTRVSRWSENEIANYVICR